VRGRIPNESVIVASKHTSAYETILTLYLFHHPAVVMKAELRGIPIWGRLSARHGSIFVARDKAGAALKSMIRQARARSAEGRPVFIFPEGTRVPHGSSPPLKAGLYGVYAGLNVPIVPVAHDAGRLWTRGFVKRPGIVTLCFQPEIPPRLPREEMEARVHEAINRDPLTAEPLA
jgi:1-acyl-sn-glycerol-3-phosphate acyltransferase